ncbi:hypothetical protein FK178_04035 [Antarcticibacterium arcticum]|uniref:Uncharacterized protein n=1 Tax=Antarcticibacterium arcticum TaxID=2585771 RepID=A0A5B8YJZ8_9FLAO|nr:DUF6064 family protein [Antarcticibacterium arcticum]QED36933.1 hypothetical protein FK178_04035 [Antarcticibacterium arcticum]
MPFTIEEFLGVFESYNAAVWPMQIILNLLAVVCLFLLISSLKGKSAVINGVLIFLWLWMGLVYQIMYFTSISSIGFLFGALFVLQALIFSYFAYFRPENLSYRFKLNISGFVGIIFILYSLLIYPVFANDLGHIYPQTPTFGLPCPTTIFTFGILLFSLTRVRWYIMIIPLLWSLIGFSAAYNLGMTEDYFLVFAGVIAMILQFFKPEPDKSHKGLRIPGNRELHLE